MRNFAVFLLIIFTSELCYAGKAIQASNQTVVENIVRRVVGQEFQQRLDGLQDKLERFVGDEYRRQGELTKAELRTIALSETQKIKELSNDLSRREGLLSVQDKNLAILNAIIIGIFSVIVAIPTFIAIRAISAARKYESDAKEYLHKIKAINETAQQELESLRSKRADQKETPENRETVQRVVSSADAPPEAKMAAKALRATNEKKWDEAIIYYEALSLEFPYNKTYIFNAGLANTYAAVDSSADKKAFYCERGIRYYDDCLAYNANDGASLNNRGLLYQHLSLIENHTTKKKILLDKALRDLDKAIEIDPSGSDALTNRADCYVILLELEKDSKQRENLAIKAMQEYDTVLKKDPKHFGALHGRGLLLCTMANVEQDSMKAKDMLIRASLDLNGALVEREDQRVSNNLGTLFTRLGVLADDKDKESYFKQAEELFYKSEMIKPGNGAYNLACLAALRGEEEHCIEWINKSRELNVNWPGADHFLRDKDFETLKDNENCPSFKSLVEEISREHS